MIGSTGCRAFSAGAAAALISLAALHFSCGRGQEETGSKASVRFAQFNIWEMSTEKLTDVHSNGAGRNEQLIAAAEIIRIVRPDVLVINEIDHDIAAYQQGEPLTLNARRFNDHYLRQGEDPLDYPYLYAAPCNTGFLAGRDFDHDGRVATWEDRDSRAHGGDSYGYGAYPGQYSMAILSRYPLETAKARTFKNFLWQDLPENMIPTDWYSPDDLAVFRLSSKSHWDLPVRIGRKSIHLLVSHPTPPVFDGEEDRNGRRNYDEIKMWAHYIDGDSVLVDDAGKRGGLAVGESFLIAGDLNAAPHGDEVKSGMRSIQQLLDHPRVMDAGKLLTSEGALYGRKPGPPEFIERRTSGWAGRGLRIDHLLPSRDLEPTGGGVFWPDTLADARRSALARSASDHRMIWLDIAADRRDLVDTPLAD